MKQPVKERVERFVVLPFGMGCSSESSVAVGSSTREQTSKMPKSDLKLMNSDNSRHHKDDRSSTTDHYSNKPRSPLPNFFYGVQKLIAGGFKSFSQIFVYRDDMDEVEIEMEIGFPTDVKHVTHIGLDGSTMTNHVKGWDNMGMSITPEILSFPSLSLRQFELAMSAQEVDGANHLIGADQNSKFAQNNTSVVGSSS